MSKNALDKQEIETLKRAIEILDDIKCDKYANNIREILEGEAKEDTYHSPTTTAIQFEVDGIKYTGAYKYQQPDEGYKDG